MTDNTQPTSPEARTPTGELKDQGAMAPPTDTTLQTESPTTPPTNEASPPAPAATDETLLNKKEEKTAPAGAPESYSAFTLPEGFAMDEATNKAASDLFRELNLPQEGAQKLVDFYAKEMAKNAEAGYKLHNDMREDWRNTVKADPELGANWPKVKETIGRAIDSVADPKLAGEFRQAMDLTGAGDNPAFIRMFYKLAQMVTEGRPVHASNPSPEGQKRPGQEQMSHAQAIFPHLK